MTPFRHCALRLQAIRLPSQARRCAGSRTGGPGRSSASPHEPVRHRYGEGPGDGLSKFQLLKLDGGGSLTFNEGVGSSGVISFFADHANAQPAGVSAWLPEKYWKTAQGF